MSALFASATDDITFSSATATYSAHSAHLSFWIKLPAGYESTGSSSIISRGSDLYAYFRQDMSDALVFAWYTPTHAWNVQSTYEFDQDIAGDGWVNMQLQVVSMDLSATTKMRKNDVSVQLGGSTQWFAATRNNTGNFHVGLIANVRIAEVAMWTVQGQLPSAAQITQLAGPTSPMAIGLNPTFYARFKTNTTDLISGLSGTLVGGATIDADHPTVDDPPTLITPIPASPIWWR